MSLKDFFEEYNKLGLYPFHMPGHKRKGDPLYAFDYTETEGMDDLYNPNGIIKEAADRIRRLYNVKETFLLVNGSTVGILTALTAALNKGDRVLAARNCHKSVYNAIFLWDLKPCYILPKTYCGMFTSVTPESVELKLKQHGDIKAVVITSPTYEGAVSDIAGIAKVCHNNNCILIVDEAHGSHLKFADFLPESAVDSGADAVIQSTHKTLPSLTSTALLHICSDRIDVSRVKMRLQCFQTSSPSYVLLRSLDECYHIIEKNGADLFRDYKYRLRTFYKTAGELKNIRLYKGENAFAFDFGKLVVMTDNSKISGTALQSILREKYNIETEMSSVNHIVAMTSVFDTEIGFERLLSALRKIDESVYSEHSINYTEPVVPEYCISAYEAEILSHETVDIDSAANRISAEYIYAYPPGSPVIVPGELISEEVLRTIKNMIENNVNVISAECGRIECIRRKET